MSCCYTSTKSSVVAIVDNVDLCVSCSSKSLQKYYVINKTGFKGPSHDIATEFYAKSFQAIENYGTFLCKSCNRLNKRILDMEKNARNLSNKVMANSQQFNLKMSSKRAIQSTPSDDAKRVKRSTGTTQFRSRLGLDFEGDVDHGTALEPSKEPVLPSGTKGTILESSAEPLLPSGVTPMAPVAPGPGNDGFREKSSYKDKETQCNLTNNTVPFIITSTCQRKGLITYASSALKKSMSPVVQCLAAGRYRKATRLLLSSDNKTVKKESLKGVTDVVRKECSQMIKTKSALFKKTSKEELLNFNFDEIICCLKQESSVLWNVLSTVATTQSKFQDNVKIITAALVLLNARSKFLCRFQYMVSISMYNNRLKKEGFSILSKLGLAVSHTSLQYTLDKAPETVDEAMASMKSEVEGDEEFEVLADMDHNMDHTEEVMADMDHSMDHTEDFDYVPTPDHSYVAVEHSENEQIFQPLHQFSLPVDNIDCH